MNIRSKRLLIGLALVGACAASHAQNGGLWAGPAVWPQWQARAAVIVPSGIPGSTAFELAGAPAARPGLSLLGDYYLLQPQPGDRGGGGLRASAGVFVGPRALRWAGPGPVPDLRTGLFSVDRPVFGATSSRAPLPADAAAETGPVPYLGLGYTGLSASGRWGYSADLGMLAGARDGLRPARGLTGGKSLDEAIRDLRWSPMLQVGVSYSF